METRDAPDLTAYRRLLIFGGSFDPPHTAHVELPQHVARAIGADVVVYIPAGRAPHKLDKVQTDPAHRLAMLRRALATPAPAPGISDSSSGEPGGDLIPGVVLTIEIERAEDGRPSYTVDTLEDLARRIHPDAEMRLLIGTDQVDIFETWRDWQRVIELAEPVVMRRPPPGSAPETAPGSAPGSVSGSDVGVGTSGEVAAEDLPPAWRGRAVDVPETPISSTAVRARVAAGESIDGWVHPEVAAYIAEHGLYRA